MVTKQEIIKKLKTVFDPHIPISVYDLGLILDIDIENKKDVFVKMTFTTPSCPMKQVIAKRVENAVKEIKGVGKVEINLVFDIKWDPSMIKKEFRKKNKS